jgi:hypothetical protein
MKIKMMLLTAASVSLLALPALAQDNSGAGGNGGQGGQPGQAFDARKAEVVQHIGDRIAELQKAQACAQAATDPQSLRACLPNRGERGGQRGGHGGDQGGGGGSQGDDGQ